MATDFSVVSEADSAELVRLTLSVDPDHVETVRAVIADHFPAGWSERRLETSDAIAIDVWVPARVQGELAALLDAVDRTGVPYHADQSAESIDWRAELERGVTAVEIRGRLQVRPPWVPATPGLIDIEIDPGMAFGTGQHATTCGCLDLLLDVPPGSLVDVGTGSGVLAIAAAKLGHFPVVALDTDPLAVEAAHRNAATNGVQIDVRLGAGESVPLPGSQTILANITRRDVIALALAVHDDRTSFAVLSGFLDEDMAEATAPWQEQGFQVRRVSGGAGWTAVLLVR